MSIEYLYDLTSQESRQTTLTNVYSQIIVVVNPKLHVPILPDEKINMMLSEMSPSMRICLGCLQS